MKFICLNKLGIVYFSLLLLAFGCSKDSGPLEPLTVAQLPAAMEKAFSTAKGEVKDLATQIIASVQAQDYAKAYLDLQKLSATSELNKEQGRVANRALLTINSLLRSSAANGEVKSAAALEHYQRTK